MNIFVARLNFKTRREELEAAFAKFGQVSSAKIVKDRDSGRSKGFGFVEMPSKTEGQSAIEGLNGKDLQGKSISVNEARPRVDKRGGKGNNNRGHGDGSGNNSRGHGGGRYSY